MPRNKGKGNKRNGQKKAGNNEGTRDIVFKEEGQEYAQVSRMLGNGRLEAKCFDGKTRQCHIRGQMQRKVWINVNDVILVSLREYEDNKADVIKKYNSDEIIQLKKCKEIPERLLIEEEKQKGGDVRITFGGSAANEDNGDYFSSSDDEDGSEEEEDSDDGMPPPQQRNYTLDDL